MKMKLDFGCSLRSSSRSIWSSYVITPGMCRVPLISWSGSMCTRTWMNMCSRCLVSGRGEAFCLGWLSKSSNCGCVCASHTSFGLHTRHAWNVGRHRSMPARVNVLCVSKTSPTLARCVAHASMVSCVMAAIRNVTSPAALSANPATRCCHRSVDYLRLIKKKSARQIRPYILVAF
jgi:hypothetical protein